MKDFYAEEIEGKSTAVTLPAKSPIKDFYSEEIENDFYSKEVKPSITLKINKPKNWVAEGLKKTVSDLGITDIPAQLQDLLTIPSRILRTPRPPLVSKLATQTLPYIAEKVTKPLPIPPLSVRNIRSILKGKGISETSEGVGGDLTLLDIGIAGVIGKQGIKNTVNRTQWNTQLNKAIQTEEVRESILNNIDAFEKVMAQSGIKLPVNLPLEDKVNFIISQGQRSPTLGNVIIKLSKGSIKPMTAIARPIVEPTIDTVPTTEPTINPTTITPVAPKTITSATPTVPPIIPTTGLKPIIPEEITAPKVKILKKVLDILPEDVGKIKNMAQQISEGEAGKRVPTESGTWIGIASSFPDYFRNKGYTKKQTLDIIEKVLNNQPITEKQQVVFNDLLEGYKTKLNQEIETYEQGKQEDKFRAELKGQGYSESDIEEIIRIAQEDAQSEISTEGIAISRSKFFNTQKEADDYITDIESKGGEAKIVRVSAKEIEVSYIIPETLTPSGQIRTELHPPFKKDLFQTKGELFKKDYYAEEVEAPSAFAGTISEETPTAITPSTKIIKRSQIIKNLGEKLGVPIRRGGYGGTQISTRGALGIYKPKPDIIRWKSGGVGTISHEIGHFLDDNFDDLHKLIRLSRQEIGPLDYDSMKQRANEGFSEFLRYWITQPQIALQKAPQFHAQFNQWLSDNPDVKNIIDEATVQYQTWLKMPSIDKVRSQISFTPETQTQGMKQTIDSLYNKVIDELAPIQRYVDLAKAQGIKIEDEDNPYILARLLKGNTGKANHFINHKTFNTKLEITGKGLREILTPVKDNLEDLSTYLVAKRTPELKDRNKEVGINKQDALNTIIELDAKYPQFKGITEELYAYQDRLLQYAVENGLISPVNFAKMKLLNQNYVPFYRVFEELQRKGYMGDTLANLSNPIKKMSYRGSEREIIDPIESIMKNTYAIINTADRNAVARGMIILSNQHKELGRLFEKIAMPLSKVATVDLGKEINKILAENGSELAENDINLIIDIFRPSMFLPKDNTITVMQNGKKELYYVDPEIYKAMMGLEKEEMSMLIKILSYPARWLRAGATSLSPEFIARNPLRDQFSAFIYSKTGYIPGVDLARGIFNLLGKSDLYWEWVRGGGEHSTIVSVDREYMRQNLKELFEKNWKDIINPLKWMQALSEFGEQGTRLGEFMKDREKRGIKSSAFASRNVTLDFARMGSKIKTANKITAFMNANIQGLNRPFQAFKEKPGATWAKIITGITLPSIILYLMNKDDERYKELPRWQKDLFWIIRTPANNPSGELLLRIPKPFELGVIFGTIPERILEYINTKDPEAFNKLRDTVLEGAYLNPKQWIPTSLVPILENMTNWSIFRDKKLETMGMERVIPEERYTAFTSETAKKLGKLLGYSPVKIENLVSGYTGGGGNLTLDLLDYLIAGGKRKLPLTPESMPLIRGFIAKEPVGIFSESVNKFYENYNKITEVYNTMREANKKGDREKFNELRKRYPKVNPMINGMIVRESKRLAEGRKEINKILDDENITPEIKLQKIRNISVKITEIAKKVNSHLKGE